MYESGYINRSSYCVLQNTEECRRSITS